jgi:hypothetical protein
VRYQQGDFNMTADSKLFPTRTKWEADGYIADEYGHWLKGEWRPYVGPADILDRDKGFVLSRDRTQALQISGIQGVALPLLEGNSIDQFQASAKGWVAGKGRSAVWREIPPDEDVFEPQYLIGLDDARSKVIKSGDHAGEPKWRPVPKVTFIDVTAATNVRTARVACTPFLPCGNSAAILNTRKSVFSLATAMNTFVYDFVSRARCGGLHLNWFVVEESALPTTHYADPLDRIGQALLGGQRIFAGSLDTAEPVRAALTRAERLRLRCISEAVVAFQFGLSTGDFKFILSDCDHPCKVLTEAFTQKLDPKGFWRIDKEVDPELRFSVLAIVAFQELQVMGVDAFLEQNNSAGWMLPEMLQLSDYGLGRDERSEVPQLVAMRLGPRFLDSQLAEDTDRLRQARRADAELIRSIVPLQYESRASSSGAPIVAEESSENTQEGLF